MKIRIYTGVTVAPKDCLFDDLHPKFQILNFRHLVEQGLDFELATNSDFIIRELNCFIMDDIINVEDVKFFEDSLKLEHKLEGFSVKSIDDVIEEQNKRINGLYYTLKFVKE